MKDEILKALAEKWVREAAEPEVQDGSAEAQIGNALSKGVRMGMNRCAADVGRLIDLLGETK